MGKRSGAETIVAIMAAFAEQRTWAQAELARHVDVGVPALRRRLDELSASGVPLTREDDHPHVYWSVPKGWFPGGVIFRAEDVPELGRQLRRLPPSPARERLLQRIVEAAPRGAVPAGSAILAPRATTSEQSYLPLVEDAANRRTALAFTYFTTSRGAVEERRASVQRVVIGPPARFLALCHRDGNLKWFRLDNVHAGRLDDATPFRPADPARVEALLRESVDGYHPGLAPQLCVFWVRSPESNWVNNWMKENLGDFSAVPTDGGVRFEAATAGVSQLARFIVGLGDAARAETLDLAAMVRALAEGALAALDQS